MDQNYPFQPHPLPYSYISMMPYVDANTLYFHHDQYYIDAVYQLNSLVAQHGLTNLSLEELLKNDLNLPVVQENRIRNFAGAIYNHQFYFKGLSSTPSKPPVSRLTTQLTATYGSLDRFQRLLTEAAQSTIGSGWVWLVSENGGELHIAITPNNQTVDLQSVTPIFVIDMWEHAYYTCSHFDVEKYVNIFYDHLDWSQAEQNYAAASADRRTAVLPARGVWA